VDEVQQAETGYPDRAIPVEITNPVRVDELPARSGGIFTRTVPLTGMRLLSNDPRRKSATVLSLDTDIRLGTTQAEATTAAGATWPAGVPLVLTFSDEVWCQPAAGSTATVSVVVEHWAR
jgi:hypothetical protein